MRRLGTKDLVIAIECAAVRVLHDTHFGGGVPSPRIFARASARYSSFPQNGVAIAWKFQTPSRATSIALEGCSVERFGDVLEEPLPSGAARGRWSFYASHALWGEGE